MLQYFEGGQHMAFSDFNTIPEVLEKFRITYTVKDFVEIEGPTVTPSEHFLEEFEFCLQHIDIFASEAARCEAIIFPILKEVYKAYADDYALWIKKTITYDETLSGTPDYLISTRSELGIPVVGIPLIILVEAKKNDFDQGWGQCIAEMLAAQKINGDPDTSVYGIVSDGKWWEFGQLVRDAFIRNRTSVTMDNLPRLFGAIDAVFKVSCNGHHSLTLQENSTSDIAVVNQNVV